MSGPRSSVIPDLIDALVANLAVLLPTVTVCDGVPEVANSGAYLCVGVDDWDATNRPVDAARSSIEWASAVSGMTGDESGSITCVAWCQEGGTGQAKTVRDTVYAIHAATKALLVAQLAANPAAPLGVAGLWDVRVGGTDALNQSSDQNGAAAVLRFPISFQARI